MLSFLHPYGHKMQAVCVLGLPQETVLQQSLFLTEMIFVCCVSLMYKDNQVVPYKKETRVNVLTRVSEERQLPTLPIGVSVPSAMVSLTSLFGMGRGGSSPQLPPQYELLKEKDTEEKLSFVKITGY